MLLTTDEYRDELKNNIALAKNEIILISAFITEEALNWLIELIQNPVRGVIVCRFRKKDILFGATDLEIFWHIMLPLARPVIATLLIFNFMTFWNELLIALTMVTKSELRTLPLAMMNFIGENRADYGMGAASLVVGMAPVVILYIALSERFVQGMTAGAIKG